MSSGTCCDAWNKSNESRADPERRGAIFPITQPGYTRSWPRLHFAYYLLHIYLQKELGIHNIISSGFGKEIYNTQILSWVFNYSIYNH